MIFSATTNRDMIPMDGKTFSMLYGQDMPDPDDPKDRITRKELAPLIYDQFVIPLVDVLEAFIKKEAPKPRLLRHAA